MATKVNNKDIALEVKGVSKSFHLPTEQSNGIKQAFINWTKGVKGYKEQRVLKDISFTVEKGDFFGIVGRNGSGKSTLLKLISQIYTPDNGKIVVNGKLVPFIELGVGFNPELTGRENIYLNGALLGFSHDEMSAMYEDIVKFAELEEFMDQKLKNYSSGMQVRLAFSIAIKADADILVLDEVLAVGDEAFQRKCFNYFAELKRAKKTVILVTHSMEYIQQFCNRAALIDRGHRIIVGDPLMIANMYQKANSEDLDEIKDSEKRNNNDDITVKTMCDKTDDLISLDIEVTSKYTLEDAVVTAVFNRNNGEIACRWASDDTDHQSFDIIGGKSKKIRIEFDNIFPDGVYDIQISVKKQDRTKEYAVFDSINKFEITSVGPYWMPHFKEEVQR